MGILIIFLWNIMLNFLKELNNNYSNLFLIVMAIIASIIAYREYILRRRPYVLPEITFEIKDDKWFFNILLINKGEYPCVAKIVQAVLKIGDEEYPTPFNEEVVLSPGEKQKIAPMGHINENGRRKIIGHEYRINRVEIILDIASKSLRQKKLKYHTNIEYEVDVIFDKPVFKLIKEKMF